MNRHIASVVAAIGLLTPACITHAQITIPNNTRKPSDTPKPPQPTAQPETPGSPALPPITTTTPLSDEIIEVDYIGLSMKVPLGMLVVQGAGGDQKTVYQLLPENQKWTMSIQVHQSTKTDLSIRDIIESIQDNVRGMAPMIDLRTREVRGSEMTVVQKPAEIKIAGSTAPGERMYLALPAQGKGQQIRGYTVFKPLPTTFVVYELVAPDEYFEAARSQYELATATTVFSDPAAAVAARAKMIAAGQDFLNTLTEERLASLADGEEKMYRLYAPSPAGSAKDGTEVGYRTIKVWKGRRSEVSSDSLGNGRDNPEGLLVRTQGRILDRLGASGAGGKGMRIIDTETTAFLSFDRKEEAWITKTAIRDEKNPSGKPSVASEMGARNGRSMNIVQRLPGKADTVIQPLLQGTNYISQAEVQLLGTLLATSKTEGEFGFYAYRPEITTISLRRDTVKRDPANAGAITISTRVRDNKPGPTSIYREDGSLVRTELPPPDGTIWEPSDAETLIRLWRSKGLPVGSN